ncbi:unnamed protein product, partial [Larinioides sclopetarius]
ARSQGSHHDPYFQPGRTTIVHLFEWKWNDIADECEQFLGLHGYGGVQVSTLIRQSIKESRPWYERYQPVSYKLFTRSGNEREFREMVRRCNNVGVRIYVDTVINHMTGNIGAGNGTAGSYFDPSVPKYDVVPYGPDNFNKGEKCPLNPETLKVRNCRLAGLADLDLGQEYVRKKITEYMNKLIEIGVAGFRIDAAKHMWPTDLQAIYGKLNNLKEETFGSGKKPFIYQEVIDLGGEAVKSSEYVGSGRVTEFKYGMNLGDAIRKNKNKKLKQLRNFGEGWDFMSGNNALAFVDNHDNQRGHGAGGYGSILTHRQTRMYKMAVAFMLAWPYGVPRVMSSFSWPENIVKPPHDRKYNIKSVKKNPDLSCGNGWVCEHRWRQIFNMVKFRNVVGFDGVSNWWDNDNNQIAFSRGNKGFIAINNEDHQLNQCLKTGLPRGTYCDIISGNKVGNRCTGRSVQVGRDGKAQIQVDSSWEVPMIAIHIKTKL